MTENDISKLVFQAALKVHKALGPGLLERTYQVCLAHELVERGLRVEMEKAVPVVYDGIELEIGYRIDILVEGKFVIEVKAVDALAEIHMAQTLTYLRLSGCKLGFLINFNEVLIKDGVRRVINGRL